MKRIPVAMRLEVEERAPRYAEAVRRVIEVLGRGDVVHGGSIPGRDQAVLLNLAAFRGDFALLYQCLWYADSKNVPVLFTARGERRLR